MEEGLRRDFLKGAPKSEVKAVKAFVAGNAENALKTKPKVSSCRVVCVLVGAFARRVRLRQGKVSCLDGYLPTRGSSTLPWTV